MTCFVYMLACGDGTLYTGWTPDLARRLQAHRTGKGAKYTRGRGPLTLAYTQCFATKSEALRREAQLKALTRAEKLALCAPFQQAVKALEAAGEQEALALLERGARPEQIDEHQIRLISPAGEERQFSV